MQRVKSALPLFDTGGIPVPGVIYVDHGGWRLGRPGYNDYVDVDPESVTLSIVEARDARISEVVAADNFCCTPLESIMLRVYTEVEGVPAPVAYITLSALPRIAKRLCSVGDIDVDAVDALLSTYTFIIDTDIVEEFRRYAADCLNGRMVTELIDAINASVKLKGFVVYEGRPYTIDRLVVVCEGGCTTPASIDSDITFVKGDKGTTIIYATTKSKKDKEWRDTTRRLATSLIDILSKIMEKRRH